MESEALLSPSDAAVHESAPSAAEPLARAHSKRLTALSLAVAVVVSCALAAASKHVVGSDTLLRSAPDPASSPNTTVRGALGNVTLQVSNDRERRQGRTIGEGYYKEIYPHLADLYQPTALELAGIPDDATCSWRVGNDDEVHVGSPVTVIFEDPGSHDVTVTCQRGGSGPWKATYAFTVAAKYVRKEVTSMLDEERSDFLSALQVLYNTQQEEGEALYGRKYRSIAYLVAEHLHGAADKECDHWHDDAGFFTHHISFTLELEQSLQSVSPKVTVPYWDYTADASTHSHDFTLSAMFQDDWFGPVPDDESHIVASGRWAYTPLMTGSAARNISAITNPYGILRSPWNTDHVPYLRRARHVYGVKDGGFTLPGCADFKTALDFEWIGRINSYINGLLHGPVHIMTGGQWWADTDRFRSNQFTQYLAEAFIANNVSDGVSDILLSSKFLWRQGVVRCPEYCSDDTPQENCECTCPTDILGDRIAHDVLMDYGIYHLNEAWINQVMDSLNHNHGLGYDHLLHLMCHFGHAGEMFTSAAPYDPMFWPIHGLSERFVAFKRILVSQGVGKLNETWGYHHEGNLPSDTRTVCDWSEIHGHQLPYCFHDTCTGHRAEDLLPQTNFLGRGESYTNEEFYAFISPFNTDLPYVYDSFTSWPGCADQGIDFV